MQAKLIEGFDHLDIRAIGAEFSTTAPSGSATTSDVRQSLAELQREIDHLNVSYNADRSNLLPLESFVALRLAELHQAATLAADVRKTQLRCDLADSAFPRLPDLTFLAMRKIQPFKFNWRGAAHTASMVVPRFAVFSVTGEPDCLISFGCQRNRADDSSGWWQSVRTNSVTGGSFLGAQFKYAMHPVLPSCDYQLEYQVGLDPRAIDSVLGVKGRPRQWCEEYTYRVADSTAVYRGHLRLGETPLFSMPLGAAIVAADHAASPYSRYLQTLPSEPGHPAPFRVQVTFAAKQFHGAFPDRVRSTIAEWAPQMDELFIIAEAEQWDLLEVKEELRPKPLPSGDPLLVGMIRQRDTNEQTFWLLETWDPTPVEDWVRREWTQNPS